MSFNSKATATTNNDYSCHIKVVCGPCLTNNMESISHYITALVINSLGMDTHTNTHTGIHTETFLRNQVHAGLWAACTYFKNHTLASFSFLSKYQQFLNQRKCFEFCPTGLFGVAMSPRSASHRPRHDWRALRDVSPTQG